MLFTDEILEKILTREDVSKVPLVYQSAMIHAIKEVLEEENVSDAKSEYGIYPKPNLCRISALPDAEVSTA